MYSILLGQIREVVMNWLWSRPLKHAVIWVVDWHLTKNWWKCPLPGPFVVHVDGPTLEDDGTPSLMVSLDVVWMTCLSVQGGVRLTLGVWQTQVGTVETLYNTINFCWSTHKRHSIARPKGRGMGCLLWVQRATYCVDLSILSSIKYLL